MSLFQFVSPKEAKEAKRIVKTPLTVQANASVSEIYQAIFSHVNVASDNSSLTLLNPIVYIRSKSSDSVTYGCGNKVNPKMFVAELSLSQDGEQATAVFKVISHFEQSGTVIQSDLLMQLRKDIRKALTSFSSSTVISE